MLSKMTRSTTDNKNMFCFICISILLCIIFSEKWAHLFIPEMLSSSFLLVVMTQRTSENSCTGRSDGQNKTTDSISLYKQAAFDVV